MITHGTRVFGIAYGVLRSAIEEDDVVQDMWIRWQSTDGSTSASPLARRATAIGLRPGERVDTGRRLT
jgi:hypothetical protein